MIPSSFDKFNRRFLVSGEKVFSWSTCCSQGAVRRPIFGSRCYFDLRCYCRHHRRQCHRHRYHHGRRQPHHRL